MGAAGEHAFKQVFFNGADGYAEFCCYFFVGGALDFSHEVGALTALSLTA